MSDVDIFELIKRFQPKFRKDSRCDCENKNFRAALMADCIAACDAIFFSNFVFPFQMCQLETFRNRARFTLVR